MNKTSRLQEAIKQIHLTKQEVEDPNVSQNLEQALGLLQIVIDDMEDGTDAYQLLSQEKKQ